MAEYQGNLKNAISPSRTTAVLAICLKEASTRLALAQCNAKFTCCVTQALCD